MDLARLGWLPRGAGPDDVILTRTEAFPGGLEYIAPAFRPISINGGRGITGRLAGPITVMLIAMAREDPKDETPPFVAGPLFTGHHRQQRDLLDPRP